MDGITTVSSVAPITSRSHHRILIIGGGTAGLTIAARLRRADQSDIALIEPSDVHYYQPLWTLVGAGQVSAQATMEKEAKYIPGGVHWIQDAAEELDPIRNAVRLRKGGEITYDFLVLCPGIQLNWDAIAGLREALETPHVSSNYTYALAPKTWRMIREFRGGNAVFTHPGTPIKCAGAPQKIMYLAADHFGRTGIGKEANVIFGIAGAAIFAVREFAAVLTQVVERYHIDVHFKRELVEVRPREKEAVFEIKDDPSKGRETIPYDILHVTPPMSAPDFIKRSLLAVKDSPLGWAKVNKNTLQSPDYPNVFALGDAGSTPNSKTGAAIRKQAPVVIANLLAVMAGKEPPARYDGYASCPLVTAHNRCGMAEFNYDLTPTSSFPYIDTDRERYDMYLLKRYGLPWMYWNLMLRSRF